jgi:hypothetical protein
MSSVLNLILSHESAGSVAAMLAHWAKCVAPDSLLLAYGGNESEFSAIDHKPKFLVADKRLRTKDHQREFQSYTGLFRTAAEFLKTDGSRFQYLHFAEYDHIPLVPDLNDRQIKRLTEEDADVLGYHVHRIDQTNSPHFLYHAGDERFASFWSEISARSDTSVVLSMFGSGGFWTKEAFLRMTELDEPCPIYLEIYLPTIVHHLGFRVRDFGEQEQFVRAFPDAFNRMEKARRQGAWTLHPVKQLWSH